MKKISIISPVFENINRVSETMTGLIELFDKKYEFEVFYYYSGSLPEAIMNDPRFTFIKIEKGQSHDDCVTNGFKSATGDCVIVADLDNINYREYIRELIIQWENRAQIVLTKRDDSNLNFFQKIKKFFVGIGHAISNIFTSFANLSKDFRAFKTFQLFARNVVEVMNEFPEKNYYLRNFDCWVDFRVSIVYVKENIKVKRHQKKSTGDLWSFIGCFMAFVGAILALVFTTNLIPVQNQSMFTIIGIGITAVFGIFALFGLYHYILYIKTNLRRRPQK